MRIHQRTKFLFLAIAPDVPAFAEVEPHTVDALLDAVQPWRSTATLPNFLGRSRTPTDVTGAWPAEQLTRLLEIKHEWDPSNMFRLGHAVLPTRRCDDAP